MKKKLFFVAFFLFLCLFIESCNSQIKNLNELFLTDYPKYNIIYSQKGTFTKSGNDEYIVFYENPKYRYDEKKPNNIDKIVVFSIKNNSQIMKYEIEYFSHGYNDYAIDIIKGLKLDKQVWNGFCYVGDYNQNNLDEIILFGLGGNIFVVNIFEYNHESDNFQKILKYPSHTSLSKIEAKSDGKKKIFMVYDTGGPKTPEGKRNWYLMKWNEKTNKYEVAEQGIQNWFDPKTGKIIIE